MITKLHYIGGTPTGAGVTTMFTTAQWGGADLLALGASKRYICTLKNDQAGTLRWYGSNDRGVSWFLAGEQAIPSAGTGTNTIDIHCSVFSDFKVEWTNGGVDQGTWIVNQGLDDDRSPVA